MSDDSIKLNSGDSAIIIRHYKRGFDMEIYHKHDTNILTEDDSVFYALLTRGMVHNVLIDTDQVLEDGKASFAEDTKSRRITIH